MTTKQWQVIIALCKCVIRLALGNIHLQREIKILNEAISEDIVSRVK